MILWTDLINGQVDEVRGPAVARSGKITLFLNFDQPH